MTKKSDAPAIRFKGFSDAWEQRKLSEITDKVTEKNAGLQYVETFTNSAEFGIISQRDFFDHDIAKLGSLDGYYIVKTEDFVYNPRISTSAPVGPINRNKLGRTGVMSPLYTVFRPHDIDTTYLEYFFKCGYWHSFMNFNGDSGARSDRFSIRDNVFFQMPIPIPDIDEQRKIGELLTCLDNLITLHQRKFEKLTNVKKSMLEKMFPQNGSSYPEIRFKGFTDPWEQRKFGEVFMSLQNNTLSRAELNDEFGAAQNIHYGDVLIKYDEILDVSKEPLSYIEKQSIADKFKTSYLQNGDVIIADTAEDETVGKCTEIEGLTDQKVISGLHTMPVRPNRKFASGFLGFYLNSAAYHDQLKPLMQGIKVTSISKGAMQDTVVKFPLDLKEQEQIGIYFGGLDHLITLHQRKCALLFSPFQAFISMMFTTSTFSWEQRKLGDIGKARSGVGFPDADQGGVTGVPFFKVSDMNLDGNENEMIVANNYVTTEQIAEHRWSPITELPAIFFAKVGAAVMLNRKRLCRFPFLLDNNTMAYSLSPTKWDADFAKALFGTVDLTSLVQVGALPSYNAGDVESMGIYLPSLFEQEQIGAFFKLLDNLITLHQRKCIFFTGRAGRLISTVNKKRITSSWEQREVGDLLIERSQQAPMSYEYPLMAFIANEGVAPKGERYDRSALVTDTVNKLYKKTEKGDFIYSSNNLETGSIGLNKYGKACISPVYSIFEPTGIADSDFLGRRLVRKDFINAMVKWRQGVIYGQWRIHESDFLKIEISVPSVEEQRKIGAYLDQLDNLITLHQRKPFLMKWRTSDANRNQTNRLVL